MLDFPFKMLWVKLPVVDRIQPQSNKFATGLENETSGDSKLNDSPAKGQSKSIKVARRLEEVDSAPFCHQHF